MVRFIAYDSVQTLSPISHRFEIYTVDTKEWTLFKFLHFLSENEVLGIMEAFL